MPSAVRNREARLRRRASRQGLVISKSRSRIPDDPSFGGYMVIDAVVGMCVAGGSPVPFMLDLDAVEQFLTAP